MNNDIVGALWPIALSLIGFLLIVITGLLVRNIKSLDDNIKNLYTLLKVLTDGMYSLDKRVSTIETLCNVRHRKSDDRS